MEKVKISLASIARRPGPQESQRAEGLAVVMGVPPRETVEEYKE